MPPISDIIDQRAAACWLLGPQWSACYRRQEGTDAKTKEKGVMKWQDKRKGKAMVRKSSQNVRAVFWPLSIQFRKHHKAGKILRRNQKSRLKWLFPSFSSRATAGSGHGSPQGIKYNTFLGVLISMFSLNYPLFVVWRAIDLQVMQREWTLKGGECDSQYWYINVSILRPGAVVVCVAEGNSTIWATSTPLNSFIVLLGDFNPHVGDNGDNCWSRIGRNSLPEPGGRL